MIVVGSFEEVHRTLLLHKRGDVWQQVGGAVQTSKTQKHHKGQQTLIGSLLPALRPSCTPHESWNTLGKFFNIDHNKPILP